MTRSWRTSRRCVGFLWITPRLWMSKADPAYLDLARLQMWTEQPSAKSKKAVNKDRFISKMFLRCVLSSRHPSVYQSDLTTSLFRSLSAVATLLCLVRSVVLLFRV